ncbi:MAG: IS5 family transposase [Marinomonas primoryensis]|jgi:IS5 family transposase
MSHQLTFADSEFNNKRRNTRKEIFLSRMNELFGFRKAIYRGLAKNDSKLAMLFALANVFRVDQMTRAARV